MPARVIAALLITTAAITSSCALPMNVSTNADALQRGTYTQAQALVYREYVFEHLEDTIPPDMREYTTFAGATMPTDAEWGPYETRAKALCDDARTNGWPSARDTYAQQAHREMLAQMPADAPDDMRDITLNEAMPLISPLMEVQIAAVTEPGSFCPDIS